jgi:elongation factor Tu
MAIEDVFSIKGRGTIATGLIESGIIRVADEVEVVGLGRAPRRAVVAGVEMFAKTVDYGTAGDAVGLVLRGVERTELEHGQILAASGTVTAHTRFEAEVYVLTPEEGGRRSPIFTGYRPQFYFHTIDVTGAVTLPPGVAICLPGETVSMTVELAADSSIPLDEGLRFVFREGGRTVGVGTITRVLA